MTLDLPTLLAAVAIAIPAAVCLAGIILAVFADVQTSTIDRTRSKGATEDDWTH